MATVLTIRQQCLAELCKLKLEPMDMRSGLVPVSSSNYFKELEGRIYDLSGSPQQSHQMMLLYYRKYIQLLYNLRLFGKDLIKKYTPSELVFLSESDLNPDVARERAHNAEQSNLYKRILSQGIEDEDDQNEEGGNRCKKCKNSRNISIVPRQLRSADEPASLFLTCNACGWQWRIG